MSVKAILYGQSYTKAEMDELLDDVQDSLQFDDIPTVNSNNPVKSGGIYNALSNKQDTLNFDNQPTSNSQRMLTSGSIYTALSTKQNTLTIATSVQQGNNNPVSSGAVYTAIQGLTPEGDLIVVDDELSSTSENPVQNKVIYDALEEKVDNSALADYATISSVSGKAPTNHASSATTYGVGTDSNYGHLKITDNATNTAASSGIAISPKAVYNLTQTVNGKQAALSSDNPLPVSSGGTGATTFTSGALLIGNGTSAVSTRSITNNTSATAIGTGTNIPTMNTIYNGLPTINNAHTYTSNTTIYAPTAGGTANTQALVGNGTTTAPKWVNISPSITITDGDASNAPKINVSALGQSGTAQSITTASTSVYGVTKLTDSYTSTNKTLAATGASILAAIQGLDVSSVGGSGKYISAISETDGKISATATSTSVSNTWTNGTTDGPTIKTTVNGVTGTAVAIPAASTTASGVITVSTDENVVQRFKGTKGFGYLHLYGDQAGSAKKYTGVIRAFPNNESTEVAEIYYIMSSTTSFKNGRWIFGEFSPTSTDPTVSTGFRENYRLPTVNDDLTSGVNYDILTSKNPVTIAQGGTGLSASPSMLVNLGSTSAANILVASPRPGVTGVLGAANGGTGENTLKKSANALINALNDSTSSSYITQADDFIVAQYAGGGTTNTDFYRKAAKNVRVGGLTTARDLKVALGSTSAASFDGTANATSIGVSGTLPLARGGTGVTSLAALQNSIGICGNEFSGKSEITLTFSTFPAYWQMMAYKGNDWLLINGIKGTSTAGSSFDWVFEGSWDGLSLTHNIQNVVKIIFPANTKGWIISNKAFTIT